MEDLRPLLHVCTTCRANLPLAEGETTPGRLLFDAVAGVIAARGEQAPVRLRPVVCLASCEQGCAASVSTPGKWSYLLGRLSPAHAGDLVEYGAAYAASDNGTVWRSGRAASLRDVILARVPGHDFTQKETE